MKNYFYIERVSTAKLVFGHLLFIGFVFSFMAIFTSTKGDHKLACAFLSILLLFSSIFLISSEGIEINFSERKYRNLYTMYGLSVGSFWNHFAPISYLSLLETNISTKFGGVGFNSTATATINSKKVKINLFEPSGKYQTIYIANNRNEATIIAAAFRNIYQTEIRSNY